MSLRVLLSAFGLAIILEGVLPFLSPRLFRQGLCSMLEIGDRRLRWMGLAAMLAGLIVLYAVRLSA